MLWELSGDEWLITFSLASSLCFLCGWIADRIMGYTGFGVIGNWLVLLGGCYGGLVVFNQLGHRFDGAAPLTVLVAAGGATLTLVALSGAKSLTQT